MIKDMNDNYSKTPTVKQLTSILVTVREGDSLSCTLYLEGKDSDDLIPIVNIPEELIPKLEL